MSNDAEKIIYSMIKVSKNYNNRPVLKGISLSYFYGAKIGVLGLNGSGKSTLLFLATGMLKPDQGAIQGQAFYRLKNQGMMGDQKVNTLFTGS